MGKTKPISAVLDLDVASTHWQHPPTFRAIGGLAADFDGNVSEYSARLQRKQRLLRQRRQQSTSYRK